MATGVGVGVEELLLPPPPHPEISPTIPTITITAFNVIFIISPL
jgi:hypothetical protein